jgi:hypothetical protein
MEILMVLGDEIPIPCRTRPKSMTSKLLVVKQMMLAMIKRANPAYTMGFRPKLSDRGPSTNCPKPIPKKIMVIKNWLSLMSFTPSEALISGRAGSMASMDRATMAIKEAIKATNSALKGGCSCIWQK